MKILSVERSITDDTKMECVAIVLIFGMLVTITDFIAVTIALDVL